jgi:hypothetical protein
VVTNLIAKGVNVELQVRVLHSMDLFTTETRRHGESIS